MTHICVGNLTIIGSDNGLSPERHQAIICTNARILLIEPLGANFSEISIEVQTFSFKKMNFKISSAKWRPFCLGLNVLILITVWIINHTPSMMWCVIIYPFLNFNGSNIEVWKCISNVISHFIFDNYFSRLGLKLTHVSKGGPSISISQHLTYEI